MMKRHLRWLAMIAIGMGFSGVFSGCIRGIQLAGNTVKSGNNDGGIPISNEGGATALTVCGVLDDGANWGNAEVEIYDESGNVVTTSTCDQNGAFTATIDANHLAGNGNLYIRARHDQNVQIKVVSPSALMQASQTPSPHVALETESSCAAVTISNADTIAAVTSEGIPDGIIGNNPSLRTIRNTGCRNLNDTQIQCFHDTLVSTDSPYYQNCIASETPIAYCDDYYTGLAACPEQCPGWTPPETCTPTVVGQWTGTVTLQTKGGPAEIQVSWNIMENGTAVGDLSGLSQASTLNQTWTYQGGIYNVTDTGTVPEGFECQENPGSYQVALDGCECMTFTLIADGCANRSLVMDGLTVCHPTEEGGTETKCYDGQDDDGDQLIDCDDPDCLGQTCSFNADNNPLGVCNTLGGRVKSLGEGNLDNIPLPPNDQAPTVYFCDESGGHDICVPQNLDLAESDCSDGIDNDQDCDIDCDDSNCIDDPACTGGGSPEVCTDGVDNDLDQYTDCNDDECSGLACTTLCGSTGTCQYNIGYGYCVAPQEDCSNGIDDDCNGYTDCFDGWSCANNPICW